MTISWDSQQKHAIHGILGKYPPDSGQCFEAADEILPVAKECDETAQILQITSKTRAPYITPKIRLAKPWYEHRTTEVMKHCVDSLTGPDGTESDVYLETHWKYPDALNIRPL